MGTPLSLDAGVAGVISEAENAIRLLNETAGSGVSPLARLLLRAESIASSRVEGLQLDVRELARVTSSTIGCAWIPGLMEISRFMMIL
jgi:hypothetical protein